MLATILGRWVGYTVSFRAVDFTLLKCSWLKAVVLSTKVTVSVAVVLYPKAGIENPRKKTFDYRLLLMSLQLLLHC